MTFARHPAALPATGRDRWPVPWLVDGLLGASLVALPAMVLGGAAFVERQASLLLGAASLLSLGAVGGIASSFAYRRRNASSGDWGGAGWVPGFSGLCLGSFALLAGIAPGIISSGDVSLAYAGLDSGAGWLLLPAMAVSVALLLRRPGARLRDGRLGEPVAVLRGTTLVTSVLLAVLAVSGWLAFTQSSDGVADPTARAAMLERRLSHHPSHAKSHRRLAETYVELGLPERAEAELDRAIALDPNDPTAQYEDGRTLMEHGRSAAAVPHLRTAVRLAPNERGFMHTLASALEYSGSSAAAESVYRAAMTRWPDDARFQALAGLTRFENGDRDAGEAEVRAAAMRDADDQTVHYAMALMLTTRARLGEATLHYKAYLAQNPSDEGTWQQYARVASLKGDAREVLRALEQMERLQPGGTERIVEWRKLRDDAVARLAAEGR